MRFKNPAFSASVAVAVAFATLPDDAAIGLFGGKFSSAAKAATQASQSKTKTANAPSTGFDVGIFSARPNSHACLYPAPVWRTAKRRPGQSQVRLNAA